MSAKQPSNQPRKWYQSRSDSQIDVTGLVDVMTELGKMTRWGRDVRYTEHLMPRQKIALNLSTTRSFLYIFIGLWIGIPSILIAKIIFGSYAAILMSAVTMGPVIWVLGWMGLNFLQGEGDLWAEGAKRVCLGIAESSIISVFVAVLGILMGLLTRKWLAISWQKLHELMVELQIPTDTKIPWLSQQLGQYINALSQNWIQLFVAAFWGTILCVSIPLAIYAFVRWRENKIRRIVAEKFF